MPLPQVRRVWPRRIQSIEEVPQAFRPYFDSFGGEFPYVIFDPAERAFSTRVHAKLICILESEVRIYEKEKSQVKEICIKIEDVNDVEYGTILLYSWITVYLSGSRAGIRLVFNSTAEPLYKPVLDRLRSVSAQGETEDAGPETEKERDKFDFMITQNHKFMNFGRKSIEPGEEIRQILFQPEMKTPYLKLFGKTFYKSFLKTSLVVLTGRELILIKEPENTRTDIAGVKQYFSLKKIKHLRVENTADLEKCILEIVFHDETRLFVELEQSRYEEAKSMTETLPVQTGV